MINAKPKVTFSALETKMHPSEEFLRDYLKDVREEMKWRRELEFQLLQFLLIFYPIIATAMITLYQTSITPQIYLVLSLGASIFILITSMFVTYRINIEHKAYANLGRIVQKIWTHFGVFELGAYIKEDVILPDTLRDPIKGFGQGQGYKRTLLLIWIVTITLIVMLIALGITKGP